MTVTINGTTGVTTPGLTDTGNATVAGTLSAGNKGISTASLPAGAVLQVVQGTTTSNTATTSTTPMATTLTASITPTSATSKILVIVNHQGVYKASTTAGAGVNLYLYKNGSSLSGVGRYGSYIGYSPGGVSAGMLIGGNAFAYLDSPATTSATTYATYFATTDAGNNAQVQADNDLSTITLMEIAA